VFDLSLAHPDRGNICGYTGGVAGTIATVLKPKAVALGGKYLMIPVQARPFRLPDHGLHQHADFVSKIIAYSKTAAADFAAARPAAAAAVRWGRLKEVE